MIRRLAMIVAAGGMLLSCSESMLAPDDLAARTQTDLASVLDAGLPEVLASGPPCADDQVHDGRVCISAGWFSMARFSAARWPAKSGGSRPFGPEPEQPVYLDSYWIDEHEETGASYYKYVQATGAAPLPELCGFKSLLMDGVPEDGPIDETSGWKGGAPGADALTRPAVCLKRSEAAAFCTWKGGRLPTVAEWLAAGRGPFPDTRRFPWGDTPPELDVQTTNDLWTSSRDVLFFFENHYGPAPVGNKHLRAVDIPPRRQLT